MSLSKQAGSLIMHACVHAYVWLPPERAAAACLVAAHLADPAAAERRDAETN